MRSKPKAKIRKSTKYFGIFFSSILLITSFTSLLTYFSENNIKTNTKEIYNYSNFFNYDYNVNLINNKYIKTNNETDKTIVYVTDLIDTTDLLLNYKYIGNKKSDLKYTYSITGRLQAIYTNDGEEQKIIDEEEPIITEKASEISGNEININETLSLDLKDKNNLLKEFKQELGMSITAKYLITLKVNIQSNIEDKPIDINYESTINISLADKTTKITSDNKKEEKGFISKEYNVNSSEKVFIIVIDIIVIIIALAILKFVIKAKSTNRIKNEFRQELNRILKICQDKIVQINTKPHDLPENIVYVKDFGEIVKVSEELFKPILYYFDTENEEAWFSVITGNTTYRYILKN